MKHSVYCTKHTNISSNAQSYWCSVMDLRVKLTAGIESTTENIKQ